MSDLLPCPFCGKTNTAVIWTSAEFYEGCDCDDDGGADSFAVVCDASKPGGKGGCGGSGGFAPTEAEAAERWNRRP